MITFPRVLRSRRSAGAAAVLLGAAALCTAGAAPAGAAPAPGPHSVQLPEPDAKFDYQIGGAYTPPSGVTAVSRDRTADPAAGKYNICYVNAYQTQPGEVGWWKDNHDDLLLKDGKGDYVVDGDWNEILLDTSTEDKRKDLAKIVGAWIDGCADAGYQAVEPDNFDSWTRSDKLLTQNGALDYAGRLIKRSHDDGLAIAQKNAAEIADKGKKAGFDFAVAEQCAENDEECGSYAKAYDDRVFVIEYTDDTFADACENWGSSLSVVRRDLDVTAPGSDTYVYDAC